MLESEGITYSDIAILFVVKVSYLATRVFLRMFLGKDRRDRLYLKGRLDYGFFWSRCFKLFGYNDPAKFLKFKSRKYGYLFYCRNSADFRVMTHHEDQVMELFKPSVGDTIVDVGAHIGNYALFGSKQVGSNGKVIAIEPDPDNFYILNKNIRLNHLDNVLLLNCAVYSEKSQIKLYTFKEHLEFSIYNTIIPTRAHSRQYTLVPSDTLDNILNKNGIDLTKISWIKIDVEGAELEVLKGTTDTLSKSRNISLLIEVHNISEGNSLYQQVRQFLESHGFRITFEKEYLTGEKHIIATRQS